MNLQFEPAYFKLHLTGELKRRARELQELMHSCLLCPRMCRIDRLAGEKGVCQAPAELMVSSYNPHFGEEQPLVGPGGSGTIFLTHCNLRCVFCINWEISNRGEGHITSPENFAQMMLTLQKIGCSNINIVTPTHYLPHILLALDIAASQGLRLPLVYNTSGWERLEILKYLDGVVDIYLPDFKYFDKSIASQYSEGAMTYPEVTQAAIIEMHRQVGVAKPAADGLIYHGLMIRHLVMPDNISSTPQIIEWIAHNLPKDTYLNLMSQYQPAYRAGDFVKINHPINHLEYHAAVQTAKRAGLINLDIQGYR